MKSEVLLFTVLLALIQSSGGFLLDGPTIGGKQTTGNTQFLTETEFIQAKQSKFDLLETKLAEVDNRNKTNNDCISMEEYVALEQKLSNVEQKLANVEQKLTNAQRKNDQMEQENAAEKNELFSLKNNSSKQNIKIEELQKLVTIKPLQEFSALQQSVHQNADKIQFLTMNEQARGQDFLALYNITITTGRKLAEMKASTNNLILELKHNQTMEMNHMKQTLDKQLTNLQTSYNATINEFETKEIYLLQQSVHLNEDKLHFLI
ncbi:Hypothetical predicted protein [Mytilus galloprovincialis]|uniref:Uncharacterized protein n=1 Tax=Mytilus galloprovincialis TaxID=29158 RepID=A0A8B6HIP3_MYTGA|nr:Hypothetical predicted protein [Mytilus galloprovincialis]